MQYISEIVMFISSGNEDVDYPNIDLVSINIHMKAVCMQREYVAHLQAQLKELNKKIDRAPQDQ